MATATLAPACCDEHVAETDTCTRLRLVHGVYLVATAHPGHAPELYLGVSHDDPRTLTEWREIADAMRDLAADVTPTGGAR